MIAGTIKVGIMPFEKYKEYTMAIACGNYKPGEDAPKIWFGSIETMSQVLSTKNLELLKLIEAKKPQSMKELSDISGRKLSNLSRTLKTFSKYGIVDLIERNRNKVPIVRASSFEIEYGKSYPDCHYPMDSKNGLPHFAKLHH